MRLPIPYFTEKIFRSSSVFQKRKDSLDELAEMKRKVEFYEAILNNLPNDLVVFDNKHTYKFINPSAISNVVTRNYLIDKNDYDYCRFKKIDTSFADERRAKFNQALETKEPFIWEDEKDKNGTPEIINRTLMPVLDAKGEVKYILGYGQNVTNLRISQRRLKQKAELLGELNSLLEEKVIAQKLQNTELDGYKTALDLTSIVSVTDSNGLITHVNQIFCDISKYKADELIGKTHKILDSGHHDNVFFKGMWDTLKAGKNWNSVIKNKAKDGTYYWVNSTIVPFFNTNGEVWQYMCIAHDITTIMNTQAKIEALNTNLESTVKERTQKLEKAYDQLENFVATVSHDLRSPIRIMSSYASLIERGLRKNETGDVFEMLEVIKKGAVRMNNIINEMLKLAHLSKNKIVDRPVDMAEMVNAVITEMYFANKDLKTKVSIGQMFPCLGDEGMLRQVWINLMSNAFKYSAKVEYPEVHVGSMQSEKGETVYYVRDNGAGFDSSKATELFKPFRRMHTNDEFEGTGIGLSIVHSIITAHGGEIWVESKPNQGCTFFFKLKSVAQSNKSNAIVKNLPDTVSQTINKYGTA